MRRLLSILLLVLLPLQFSWAAVASYCEHDSGMQGVRGGHHDLHDKPAAATDAGHGAGHAAGHDAGLDETEGSTPSADIDTDMDCGHCHGHGAALPSPRVASLSGTSGPRPVASADDTGGAHAPARPERPQWAGLA